MSEAPGRRVPDLQIPLFEQALRLHRDHLDGPVPGSGSPFPDRPRRPTVPYPVRGTALAAVLREFSDDPGASARDLHDRCAGLVFAPWDVARVLRELVPAPSPRLLRAARWLVRHGTDRRAVLVGLGLLRGNAEPRDAAVLGVIGLLRFAELPAAEALAGVPGAARDLVRLAERCGNRVRDAAVRALAGDPDPVVRDWVLSTPRVLPAADLARLVAQRCGLAAELAGPAVGDDRWDQAGHLLLAMAGTRGQRPEIARYRDATAVYRRWVALADRRSPSVARAVLLASVAEDLLSGAAAPVVGAPRGGLVDRIRTVLADPAWEGAVERGARSGDPAEAGRAAWVAAWTSRDAPVADRFAVRVVTPVPDPVGLPRAEARVLVDGMPVVASVFDRGVAEPPDPLLRGGLLRAGDEPREVRLAEAYCTEGCCGALRVTIVREGTEVVWRDWRSPTPGDPPPEHRFDAARYDREVDRAEREHAAREHTARDHTARDHAARDHDRG